MIVNFSKKVMLNLIVISSFLLICAAYVFQHFMDLQPCFLCIVQRISIIIIGLSALTILLSTLKFSFIKYIGYLTYFISAGIGLFSALRQMYLQRFPDPYVSCGPGYEYILENSSLAKSLPQLFLATGNCSEVDWSFIGLSMAEWMIPIFITYILIGLYLLLKKAA
jgi:disulfide bond formation protein DsbB